MPDTERESLNGSTATTSPTRTPQLSQQKAWQEPAAASIIANNARALTSLRNSKKSWLQYPSRFSVPPPGLSFRELCRSYPNHLDGELLVEMSDAGLKPRDIIELMPEDTRNPNLGTEWSWLTERTKKAKLARAHRQQAATQVTSVEFDGASQSPGQGVLVKVDGPSYYAEQGSLLEMEEDSNRPISQVATSATMPHPIYDTAPLIAENRPISLFSVISTPTHAPDQLNSETLAPRSGSGSGSGSSVPPLAAPAYQNWQIPQTNMTQNHASHAIVTSGVPTATSIPIDRTTSTQAMIIGGNQFSFQQSPPKTTTPSQYSTEYHHKEALREEIRKHLSLLIDISSIDEAFISRSQQQQQNEVLLQWRKWCDEQSYRLGQQHGLYVGPTVTGFVIKDSLTRLLGALTMINMKDNGGGHAMVQERARSQALEYTEALFKQYTWDLQIRANRLFPTAAPAPPATSPARFISTATSDATNDSSATRNRYGYYGVKLSSAALRVTEEYAEEAAVIDSTTDEQPSPRAYHPLLADIVAATSAAPTLSAAAKDRQQIDYIHQASHACRALFQC